MPFGLAVVLWAADLVPIQSSLTTVAVTVSRSDLARTDALLKRPRDGRLLTAAAPRAPQRLAPDEAATPDLALLVGDRNQGGQLEMGALGGGRADAPGLIHVGVGFDF